MPRIDRWVVEQVLEVLAKDKDAKIFMNLSGSSLTDQSLLDYIEDRVRSVNLATGRLVFEITETAAVRDLQHAHQWMVRLSELGCHFALDDFGVAFSSFTYLRELPVHYVKLDGSFVRNLDRDPCDRADRLPQAHMGRDVDHPQRRRHQQHRELRRAGQFG